eukprot:256553-Rhodomonas_salina.2
MGLRDKGGDGLPIDPVSLQCCGELLNITFRSNASRLLKACRWSRQSQAPTVPPDHQPVSALVADRFAQARETQTLTSHADHPEQVKAISSSPGRPLTPVAIAMGFLIIGTMYLLAFQQSQLCY